MKNKINIFFHLLSFSQWIISIFFPPGIVIAVVIVMPSIDLSYVFLLWLLLFVLIIFLFRLKSDVLDAPKIKIFDVKKRSPDVIELCILNTGGKGNVEVSLENALEIKARWIRDEDRFRSPAQLLDAMSTVEDEKMLTKGEKGRVKIIRINKKISDTKLYYMNFYIPKIHQVSVYRFHMWDNLKNVSIKDFKNIGTYKEGSGLKKKIVKWRMQRR